MKEISYAVMDPTGNITILVKTPVPAAAQPDCAARLLAAEPAGEQVGFLSPGGDGADLSLRMAGGEFCGNAAMSAAAYFCARRGDRERTVRVRVSGASAPRPNFDPQEGHTPPARFPSSLTAPPHFGQVIFLISISALLVGFFRFR